MSSFLLLSLLLCILWHLCCGQTCSSVGGASRSSSCHRSRPCRVDHPLEDIQCVPNSHVPFPYPTSLPPSITRCQTRNGRAQRCRPSGDVNRTLLYNNAITSATVDLNSIDYVRFAMNVSWNHSHNPTGGYEVRISDQYYLVECYCVSDPDLRSLYVDDTIAYPPFTYRSSSGGSITVEVLLLSDQADDSLGANVMTDWPRSCLDIEHTSSTCGLPVYNSPSDVTVYKRPSKSSASEGTLDVHWQYETSFVNPTLYYVEVYNIQNINEFYTFVVNNTNSIEIDHLSSSAEYYVLVQSYVHCSGLANRTYALGCGLWSRPVQPASLQTRQPPARSPGGRQ